MNILNLPKKTIRLTGSKSAKIKTKGNVKEAFSIGLIISVSDSNFKPLIIGSTSRYLLKYDSKTTSIGAFSQSEWINEDNMILVLD